LLAVPHEDPAVTDDTLPPGTELGRYRIVRLLGRGGMGAVYEATHRDLKKRVAIKTLHPAVAAMPAARVRFLREGEAASRISHPNVVDVTDVGTEGDITYLVMEFLEGEDLAAMLERMGALPIEMAVDILLPVVAAIAVAHEEGVIHRDLKPGNIFMARTLPGAPRPTVLDFGISKMSAGDGGTLALTGTGASMGTPYYVAPEQMRSAAGVDARSDQYALGAILYECVTGRRAHQGETIYEVIRSVGEGNFPPPGVHRPDLPPALEAAILRAMRLDPALRFASVQAFGRAIIGFASAGARQQWSPAVAAGPQASLPSTLVADRPVAGEGVGFGLLPPGGVSTARGRHARQPSVVSPPPTTTFGASAAQIGQPGRRGPGLLVGGIMLVAGGAAAAYFLSTKAKAPRPDDAASAEVAATPPPPPMPRGTYRVRVTTNPDSARFELDGRQAGSGRLDRELPVDGTEHTLTVTAPGWLPAELTFRDRPPPERVTLTPVATSPPPVTVEKPASPAQRPVRSSERPRDRPDKTPADADRASEPPKTPPAPSVRGANNSAILE
jgi:serine/threonine-protein kinase